MYNISNSSFIKNQLDNEELIRLRNVIKKMKNEKTRNTVKNDFFCKNCNEPFDFFYQYNDTTLFIIIEDVNICNECDVRLCDTCFNNHQCR